MTHPNDIFINSVSDKISDVFMYVTNPVIDLVRSYFMFFNSSLGNTLGDFAGFAVILLAILFITGTLMSIFEKNDTEIDYDKYDYIEDK